MREITHDIVLLKQIQCEYCVCLFTYEIEDINKEHIGVLCNGDEIIRNYVECPICKYENNIDLDRRS